MQGVILYGPPAAGKDTVADELRRLDTRFRTFERLKFGPGRTSGYRMATEQQIEQLRASGGIIWENGRYDAVYVVDRPALRQSLDEGFPVVHLGQVEAVGAVVEAVPGASWLVASLWCPRDVAEARIVGRGSADLDARLRAWDETEPLPGADLSLDTSEGAAAEAAQLLLRAFEQGPPYSSVVQQPEA